MAGTVVDRPKPSLALGKKSKWRVGHAIRNLRYDFLSPDDDTPVICRSSLVHIFKISTNTGNGGDPLGRQSFISDLLALNSKKEPFHHPSAASFPPFPTKKGTVKRNRDKHYPLFGKEVESWKSPRLSGTEETRKALINTEGGGTVRMQLLRVLIFAVKRGGM